MTGAIGLVDYGMGNLHSVQRAFERLGADVRPVRGPEAIDVCQALVLPGVGAFDPAMERLRASKLVEPLRRSCAAGRPLLGICLGLQLLFEDSEEGTSSGLGLVGAVAARRQRKAQACLGGGHGTHEHRGGGRHGAGVGRRHRAAARRAPHRGA